MERDSLVENTTCNAFGEFQLEYEPRRNLRLFVRFARPENAWKSPWITSLRADGLPCEAPAPARKAPRRKSIKPD